MPGGGARAASSRPTARDRGTPAPAGARNLPGDTDQTAFGEVLRRFRVRAGLSQEALAERAGLAPAAVSALERGVRRRPYPHTVAALAEALGLPAAERAAFGEAAGRPPQSDRAARASAEQQLPQSNLPQLRTTLIGREREVAQVRDLLAGPTDRLVTVTGVGGAGKTSLGLQAASELRRRFPDGVWLVELAPVADPALVPHAIADVLELRQAGSGAPVQLLASFLRAKHVLLVLDNCEHLLAACADLVEQLLARCPQLWVLVTSREPLLVVGEQLVRVPPLAVPDAAEAATVQGVASAAAVRLFLARARAVLPTFELTPRNAPVVAAVCARLDGLPLALELAAAWVRLLTPEQILERLNAEFGLLKSISRTAPVRHQTLRATLDWSHALLSEAERVVLRRLAVFVGGWDLAAAEAVCAAGDRERGDTLDHLARLVDKSLVVVEVGETAARYRLLETVRDYAAGRLREAAETAAARARHAAWYLGLAEQVNATASVIEGSRAGAPPAADAVLDREQDNVRAALRWYLDTGQAEPGLRLGAVLAGFWYVRGRYAEGRAWLDALLALPSTAPPTAHRAAAMAWAADLAYDQGDYAGADGLLGEAQRVADQVGDEATRALCLQFRGNVARARGDLATAWALYEQALDGARRLDDRVGRPLTLILMALVCVERGDADRASELAGTACELYRRLGNTWGRTRALYILGRAAQARGEQLAARAYLLEGLEQQRGLGDQQGVAWSLLALAHSSLGLGETRAAVELFSESLRVAAEASDRLSVVHCLEGVALMARGDHPYDAVRLAAAAQALRGVLDAQPYPPEREHLERCLREGRRALGAAAYAAAWASGGAMLAHEAIQLAHEFLERPLHPPAVAGGGPALALTSREHEVARLLASGCSDRQIAATLGIAPRTAGTHVRHLLAKLDMRSRWQVGEWARTHDRRDASTSMT
ncbi:MAG: helix-turn-helix domain-containing protein [Chloroflexi bacterium]|nr:helix-turn-helix domain-containing protein [Chloroflexota bacterium]